MVSNTKRRFNFNATVVALLLLFVTCALAIAGSLVRINFSGRLEGVFLLKSDIKKPYVLKDDLFLGDGHRLIFGFDFQDPRFLLYKLFTRHKPDDAYLYYEWDKKDGSGFVRNFMPDGRQMLTCFGRFRTEEKKYAHGLFVGGGLPANVKGDDYEKMNETGMSYFDGGKWFHVWCTANEDIDSATERQQVFPSSWKYLESDIVHVSDEELIIRSRHEVTISGVPLHVERYAAFRAGDTYFLLFVRITNVGETAARIYHTYGDEPWVGDYGRSRGNVGWVKDRLVGNSCWLDTKKYRYAGLFDYGNDVIGEGRGFTGTADFIEWLGADRPALYFSNGAFDFPTKEQAPLSSDTRFICLQWGPETIRPGQTVEHVMAIGMAGHDPSTGFPVKPDVSVDSAVPAR